MNSTLSKIEGVTVLSGKKHGKTLAIFAGIHGNEHAGIVALERVKRSIILTRGSVYFVHGSPAALSKNIRFIEKNLNRCFISSMSQDTYEGRRARELMTILDESDALLDLHASNTTDSTPFAICEKNAWDIAQKIDVPIISFGWDAIEPGATDGYMHRNDKPGICLECGPVDQHERYAILAENSIYQFLRYYNVIDSGGGFSSSTKRYIKAISAVIRKTEKFSFVKQYQDFERLTPGVMFATDGKTTYRAQKNQCIIFPRPNALIGHEAFILGEEISIAA